MRQTDFMQGITDAEKTFQKFGNMKILKEDVRFMRGCKRNINGEPLSVDYLEGYESFIQHKEERANG